MHKNKTRNTHDMVIGFDMDGVIINHAPNKIALARNYDVQLSEKETHSEFLPAKFIRADYLTIQEVLYGDNEIALSAPLMAGAFDVLSKLKTNNISFVLISRRRNPDNAIKLLSLRGLWGDLFTEANTFFVGQPEEKNIISLRECVTHFFDDERKVLGVIPDVKNKFLFDSFRIFDDEKTFTRVFDWKMVQQIIFEAKKHR